jgi:hypothetical protein
VNATLSELAGRIDPASQDVAGSRGLTDTVGHGTAVTGTIAMNRNGSGALGVAFESTIISLNASDPTTCADASASKDCKFGDTAIAQGIDIARQNGARVINLSLGGDGASLAVLNAVSRATAAGIVIVVSAGNDGDKPEGVNPDPFATDLLRVSRGLVIIAGAVGVSTGPGQFDIDATQISSFSNRAGTGASNYLTALGFHVRTIDQNGVATLWSGTSFSAPVISGAAALLASAFPNLTGAQIVQLLLSTADDAGAPGVDSTYGNGILNIQRAFAPQGTTLVAGTPVPVSLTSNGQGSSPMGDGGMTPKGTNAIVLDGYSRAYSMNLAGTIAQAQQERPLAQAFGTDLRTVGAAAGRFGIAVTVDRRHNLMSQASVGLAQLGLTYEDSRKAKVVAGYALSRLTPKTAIAFGFSESGKTLEQRLSGRDGNAFLIARDPMARTGFYADAGSAVGVRQQVGRFGVTATAERGQVYNPGLLPTLGQQRYQSASVSVDRRFGPATVSVGATHLAEDGTILGARFSSAFTSGGSSSNFLDASLSYDLGRGFTAGAAYRRGWTSLAGTGALVENGRLATEAWSLDLARSGAFAKGDRLAFRVMQPLRVVSGGLNLNLPVSYDYATGAVGHEDRFMNLAPTGREIDVEAAYTVGVLGGNLGANVYLRRQPGNVRSMPNDIGSAIRFTLGF